MKCKIALVALGLLVSCKNSVVASPHSYRVTRYQRIDSGYRYSSDVFNYRSNAYRPTESADYSRDALVSLLLFRAEGKLSYGAEDFESDPLLLQTLHVPKRRTIELREYRLVDNGQVRSITELADGDVYVAQGDTLFVYAIDQGDASEPALE
jgi:hypothetical protein